MSTFKTFKIGILSGLVVHEWEDLVNSLLKCKTTTTKNPGTLGSDTRSINRELSTALLCYIRKCCNAVMAYSVRLDISSIFLLVQFLMTMRTRSSCTIRETDPAIITPRPQFYRPAYKNNSFATTMDFSNKMHSISSVLTHPVTQDLDMVNEHMDNSTVCPSGHMLNTSQLSQTKLKLHL